VRRRVLVLAVAVAALALASAQCETHQCDTSTIAYGGADAGQPPGSSLQTTAGGLMIWSSSPNEGPWLDFPGNRTFVFTYPQPFACAPPIPVPELAAHFDDPISSAIGEGAGLSPFMENVPDDAGLYRSIAITNSTCGDYGLNLIMIGTPVGSPCNVQVFDVEGGTDDTGSPEAADDAAPE
jgi:hypothetical protein